VFVRGRFLLIFLPIVGSPPHLTNENCPGNSQKISDRKQRRRSSIFFLFLCFSFFASSFPSPFFLFFSFSVSTHPLFFFFLLLTSSLLGLRKKRKEIHLLNLFFCRSLHRKSPKLLIYLSIISNTLDLFYFSLTKWQA
jgi:hypothetical protein